ncbi:MULTISPECIES: lipid A-modifier LpxR family protein [Cellulophaga]|uniref:lipid A-modifier LpxR family protein n=1 Tax=Cellulophaga TaxID=104264 RepID=UPI00339D8798
MMIFCITLIVFQQYTHAQKIDNLASFRDVKGEKYFRFNYDNDFFTATDKNYTQGYSFELVAPFLKNNPVNYLFYKPEKVKAHYGLALEHIGFTPHDFDLPEIQFGDRPFAAAIMLKSFMIAVSQECKSRFTSSFSLGIIGPSAFGGDMQEAIHKATGNKIPLGWQNQIENDVVINYELGFEKQIFKYKDFFFSSNKYECQSWYTFHKCIYGF